MWLKVDRYKEDADMLHYVMVVTACDVCRISQCAMEIEVCPSDAQKFWRVCVIFLWLWPIAGSRVSTQAQRVWSWSQRSSEGNWASPWRSSWEQTLPTRSPRRSSVRRPSVWKTGTYLTSLIFELDVFTFRNHKIIIKPLDCFKKNFVRKYFAILPPKIWIVIFH